MLSEANPGISRARPQTPFVSFATKLGAPPRAPFGNVPPALQFPADAQDIESTPAPLWLNDGGPDSSTALPHTPFFWSTTKAPEIVVEYATGKMPPALQLPAEGQEIDVMKPPPPASRRAEPGTSMARPQVPFFSLTTKISELLFFTEYVPAALQLPPDGHDNTYTSVFSLASRRVNPGRV